MEDFIFVYSSIRITGPPKWGTTAISTRQDSRDRILRNYIFYYKKEAEKAS